MLRYNMALTTEIKSSKIDKKLEIKKITCLGEQVIFFVIFVIFLNVT